MRATGLPWPRFAMLDLAALWGCVLHSAVTSYPRTSYCSRLCPSSTKSDLCPFSSKVWTSSKGGAAELILVYNFQACLGLAGVARQPKPLASSYLDCWGLWHSLVGGIAPKQKAGEALLTSPSVTPANSNAFQRH